MVKKKAKKPDLAYRCEECRGTGKYLGMLHSGQPCRVCDGTGVKVSFDERHPRPPMEDLILDPIEFKNNFWPWIHFYKQQCDIIYSVYHNDETFVPAGNMLGKDFVTAFIIIWFFWTRRPCRIITTSVRDDHLRVLWGEIGQFIQTAKYPITYPSGPLIVTHREIRWAMPGTVYAWEPLSYVKGMVSEKGEGLSGHHIAQTGDGIPRTMFVGDESSGLAEICYTMATAWANRILAIGNCWDCENFFKYAVKGRPGTDDPGGDIPDPDEPGRFLRKIIRIKAEDSPNVLVGLKEEEVSRHDKSVKPTNKIYIPGVLSYKQYKQRRRLWDKHRQCVGLDADWYEGAEVKMYPLEWLNRAENIAAVQYQGLHRFGKAMGVDPAEGQDNTCWTIIDHHGIIEQISKQTPDTSVIPDETLELMREYSIEPENVLFDPGGCGRAHADRLRRDGYEVRTVPFGGAATPEQIIGIPTFDEKMEAKDVRYVFKNKRAEMYYYLRELLDPNENPDGFAIPSRFTELIRQLKLIPLWYDDEGRIYLPPKQLKSTDEKLPTAASKITMTKIIGHSPDEADSLVLAVYGMRREAFAPRVGVLF